MLPSFAWATAPLVLLALCRLVDGPGARSRSGLPDIGRVLFQELPRAFTQVAAFAFGPLGNRPRNVFRHIPRPLFGRVDAHGARVLSGQLVSMIVRSSATASSVSR